LPSEQPVKPVLIIAAIVLIVGIAAAFWLRPGREAPRWSGEADLPSFCRLLDFEGVTAVACEIDRAALEVRYADAAGRPYGSLDAFDAAMRKADRPVLLSMNAGMYHEDMSPVGLLVEDGRQVAPLETRDGAGNFFLKPNGVFIVEEGGKASVMETGAYAASGIRPRFATQSGPILVIGGAIHPRFEPDGKSRFVRNGVGVRPDGTVVLAITLGKVSLGSFARLLRDRLGCPDALFLDGAISALSNGERTLIGGAFPVGPILAVRDR
jgi:uncharacterized protein YigE (DUF2233 family)